MEKIGFFFWHPLVVDNTCCASNSPNPKNHSQTAITQQWIVWFTQTKHQNLPLNIPFTLLDSSNVQKILKRINKESFEKSQFFHFFKLLTSDPNGACTWDRKIFQHLGHHLPLIPSTITRIKILILYTILLCSTQHMLIQKTKKSHFDFWPTKSQQQTLP